MNDNLGTSAPPSGQGVRRQDIIRGASSVFDAVGYHHATMSRIAEASGLAKPTLYHYFRSKNEILFTMHQDLISELIQNHQERIENGQTPAELLVGVVGDVLALLEDRRGQVRVFFENSRELSDEQLANVLESRERYTSMVETVFREAAEKHEFRQVDPALATRALFGMCNFAYQWFRPDGKLTARQVASQFWEMFGHGVVATSDDPRETESVPMIIEAPLSSTP